jgi:hypothetical protein
MRALPHNRTALIAVFSAALPPFIPRLALLVFEMAYGGCGLEAVHDGHADVHEYAVKRDLSFCDSFFVETDCFGAVAGRGIGKTGSLGEGSEKFEIDWVVVYE